MPRAPAEPGGHGVDERSGEGQAQPENHAAEGGEQQNSHPLGGPPTARAPWRLMAAHVNTTPTPMARAAGPLAMAGHRRPRYRTNSVG
jgi:hypothetical protein